MEEYIAWTKQEEIEYGLVGSHAAKLSTRTELISEAIDPIYPNLDVDPDFHEKADIYQMWTFEDKGLICTYRIVSQVNFNGALA